MFIQSTKGAGVDRIKGVVIGPSGNGKTFLASTTGEPTLLISVESGHLTLNSVDIPMIDITIDKDQNGQIILLSDQQRYSKLISVFKWLQADEQKKKFKSIYIDGISEIGNIVIRMLEEQEAYAGHKKLLKRYGEYTSIMNKIILMFRDLPHYNVWFTALAEHKEDRDEKTNKVIKRYPATVLMPGSKIPDNVPAYFDEVLYLGNNEGKRYLLTEANSVAFAKDRSGKLEKFEKPNLAEIMKKIRGENK